MRIPGGFKTGLKNKWVRIAAGIVLCLIIFFVLSDTVFANKAQKQLDAVYAGMKPIEATLICDNGDAGQGPDNTEPWYDAFYYTDKYPETYLARTAQQKGYKLSSDLELIKDISSKNPTNDQRDITPYNKANYYLLANRSDSLFKIHIYQAGVAKLWCGGKNWGRTIPVNMTHPVVEVESTKR
ncbi:MAG TPA: hypothetical protein VG964_02080 [Candidatus Saccharimonadales bacterium]|nr:hypothetical protein [Candidatus Saccharimonadales bacterium]